MIRTEYRAPAWEFVLWVDSEIWELTCALSIEADDGLLRARALFWGNGELESSATEGNSD